VVDGVVQFNGAELKHALEEITRTNAKEKAAIHLAHLAAGMEVSVDSLPKSADAMLASALQVGRLSSNCRREQGTQSPACDSEAC
jgi:hypothetical protein